jgi:hypothetical protein
VGEFDADLALFAGYLAHVEASTQYVNWRRDNCGKGQGGSAVSPAAGSDVALWDAFRAKVLAGATPIPPDLKTAIGDSFVDAGKMGLSITRLIGQLGPLPPPAPPPPANTVWNWDFAELAPPNVTAMFDYSGTPSPAPGLQASPTGRIALVTAPDGVGRALRCEIRDSDPPWPNNTANDRAHTKTDYHTAYGGPIAVGDKIYFDMELWLPQNDPVGERFDYPLGNWYRIMEPHDQWGLYACCFGMVADGLTLNNCFFPLRIGAGGPPSYAGPWTYRPLFRMTNADGSWYMPNFNRRLHIRYGGRFAPDASGYYEAWVDGINVIPRTNHATMFEGDFGEDIMLGPYKGTTAGSSFCHYGASVMYFTKFSVEKS